MYLLAILTVTATLSSRLSYVAAFPLKSSSPVEINSFHKRVVGDRNDPHQIDIDCVGVESVCEARCLAMLCFGVPNPYQYDANKQHNRQHRTDSGYKLAFSGTDEQRAKRNTNLPASHPDWDSAEETMRASAAKGGWGAPLVPVDPVQNKLEGSKFSGELIGNSVKDSDWIKESFVGLNPNMKYCNAYMAKPPDVSVCSQKPKDGDDPIQLIVQKTNTKEGNMWKFQPMKYPTDTWASFRSAHQLSLRDHTEEVSNIERSEKTATKRAEDMEHDYLEDIYNTDAD